MNYMFAEDILRILCSSCNGFPSSKSQVNTELNRCSRMEGFSILMCSSIVLQAYTYLQILLRNKVVAKYVQAFETNFNTKNNEYISILTYDMYYGKLLTTH